MTRTQRNILIIASGLIAIGLMIFLIIRPKKPSAPSAETPVGVKEVSPILPTAPKISSEAVLPPEQREELKARQNAEIEAMRLAQIFIERYGSFTSQGNYENISDLYPLMTANMKRVANAYVAEQKQVHPPGAAYYGITTKVLSSSISSTKDDTAVVTVSAQRQETAASAAGARVFYQSASVELVRIGAEWKVDNAVFGEVK